MNVIAEYEFVKRILYVQIPLLIILNVTYFIPTIPYYLEGVGTDPLSFSVAAGLLWLLFQSGRREFRYYLAKACIRKISQNRGETEQVRCFISGLYSYNKYLLRNLKLQINDVKKIYSKILSDNNNDIYESINKIADSFKDNTNKLSPIKTLAMIENKEPDQFLVKESIGDKIQTWGKFAATVIPVALSLLSAILRIS